MRWKNKYSEKRQRERERERERVCLSENVLEWGRGGVL